MPMPISVPVVILVAIPIPVTVSMPISVAILVAFPIPVIVAIAVALAMFMALIRAGLLVVRCTRCGVREGKGSRRALRHGVPTWRMNCWNGLRCRCKGCLLKNPSKSCLVGQGKRCQCPTQEEPEGQGHDEQCHQRKANQSPLHM